MNASEDPALTAVERALVRIRRSQTRRTFGRLAERAGQGPLDVAQAVQAGYVAQAGGRAGLELISAGDDLARAVHRFRQARLDRAMREWPPEDREAFARLLTRFTDELD